MNDLYPTKTRLALLQAVADGAVLEGITPDTEGHTWLTFDDGDKPVKVNARIDEVEKAGWVYINEPPFWKLTELGREVLEAATS